MARKPVSPEAIALLESMGFVTVYDADGNVVEFLERGHYDQAVAAGRIKPREGSPRQYLEGAPASWKTSTSAHPANRPKLSS